MKLLGPCSQVAKEETGLGANRTPGEEAVFTLGERSDPAASHKTSRKPPALRHSFGNHSAKEKQKVSLEIQQSS